jgi:alpha-tubulin suppressor-like RCC1 family protein
MLLCVYETGSGGVTVIHIRVNWIICLVLFVSFIFAQPAFASKVVAIDSDTYLSAALCDDGTVLAWGWNADNFTSYVPVQINITNVKSISVSLYGLYFLKNDGTVWAMGSNIYGGLGIGSLDPQEGIVQVTGLDNVKAISAGRMHVLALKNDGTVWAWGNNFNGQIGDGSVSKTQATPVMVRNLTNVVAISAGYGLSMALDSNGTLWAWGINECGELCDDTGVDRAYPARVPIDDVKTFDAGQYGSVIVLKNDGTVWTWGLNCYDKLGYSDTSRDHISSTPRKVDGLINVIAAVTSSGNSVVLTSDGTITILGWNEYGSYGTGRNIVHGSRYSISSIGNIVGIAMGERHVLALSSDGTLWAWGDNSIGQIGNGEKTNDPNSPVKPVAIIKGYVNATNVSTYTGTSTVGPDYTNSTPIPYSDNSDYGYLGIVGVAGIILLIGSVLVANKLRKK